MATGLISFGIWKYAETQYREERISVHLPRSQNPGYRCKLISQSFYFIVTDEFQYVKTGISFFLPFRNLFISIPGHIHTLFCFQIHFDQLHR